jgi:alkylhydroperoxidase family enzyme
MQGEQKEVVDRASGGRPLNIFLTLGRYPKLLKRYMVFGAHVLRKSSLPAREREMVILRIGHLCDSGYEFHQHTRIGKEAGLSDVEIEGLKHGPDAAIWSRTDQVLLKATDELHKEFFISDPTWVELKKTWNDEQIMDLIFAAGSYVMVSMALNSLGIQIEKQ